MKSVNFWLLANLIKHVDEAFRGAAGLQEKTEPGSGDQLSCGRSEGWGHSDVSSELAARLHGRCVSSSREESLQIRRCLKIFDDVISDSSGVVCDKLRLLESNTPGSLYRCVFNWSSFKLQKNTF